MSTEHCVVAPGSIVLNELYCCLVLGWAQPYKSCAHVSDDRLLLVPDANNGLNQTLIENQQM
jgi:hypothetical protein